MAAVLDSELMKHVLVMWSDPSAALRLVYWLEHTLGYGEEGGRGEGGRE